MPRLTYLKRLDSDRIWRVRELSDLRLQFENSVGERERNVTSRSIVVMCYAHWEGYFANCVHIFLDYLEALNLTYGALPMDFFLGACSPAFNQYRDKVDNSKSRLALIHAINAVNKTPFKGFDRKVLLPRSNLNFERLEFIFSMVGLSLAPFQPYRIKLDKELVAWRHQVAHGQMFTLDIARVISHTKFSEELMFSVREAFEDALHMY
ncbi:hypothetical protein GCM10007874_38090 [Labrys miyagiensis]|uniref:MAE-28990/MAE-18760-like HEPN domain-containing protein n=1 Tax=Labrys miyagiensis TaxID=346912 RepID=A0ABQ6CKA3_9HYPH|nr:MAE_28990/MAE_18760 family HEPN-like nuclease [Labrys miyagiensis]GLS20792.1 hypothetical protein GCM10007874_38090 [Labrys miyagiensis]